MLHDSFPALYCAADSASEAVQRKLLKAHKINYGLLIAGAAAALFGSSVFFACVSALLFLASLATYVYLQQQDFQGLWYRSRALAESVKTATWRLVMGAQPFSKESEQENLESFRTLLVELLRENTGIGKHLAGDWSGHDQVTPEMLMVLRESYDKKKMRYLNDRIDDQRKWYAKKSGKNRTASSNFFWYTCGAYVCAILLLVVRIAVPEFSYAPIEVFAIVASSFIGWKQIKRFDELASAYGLTAHELGIVRSRYEGVTDSALLAAFVSDAENAFSREHTQWAARRDH